MKSKLLAFLLVFGVITLGMIGCKKDKEEPEPEPAPVTVIKPALANKQQVVSVPTKLQESSDPNAQTAVGYLGMMNSLTSFGTYFTPPGNATHSTNKNSSDTWTWSFADGQGHTITYTYIYTVTSSQYIWDIKISIDNGPLNSFMHAEQNTSGTVGNMSVYYDALSNYNGSANGAYWYYSWNLDANGFGNIYMEVHDGSANVVKYVANILADGSGEVRYYINNIIQFKLNWSSSGTGTWYIYDENGIQTSTGAWQ